MSQLVLNVDDFEPQRYARSRILKDAGFSVIEAATGTEALAIVRERHPLLVVLDVGLPDIDGREVCRQIKSEPATADILVLHLSAAFRDADSRAAALNEGADGYLVEPVEPAELVAHARALLRLASAEAQARRATTTQREADDKLRTSEERLRLAQQAGAIGVYDWDLATNSVVWSPELERMYGVRAPEDPTKRHEAWLAIVHPDDRADVVKRAAEWLESEAAEASWEYRILQPGGRQRWISARSLVLRDRDGRPRRVIGINIDVTERKELEQRLEAQRRQLEAVFQAMSDGVTVFNMAGEIVMVNDAVAHRCGFASAEEMKRSLPLRGLPYELEELDGTPVPFARWPASRVIRGETVTNWELRAHRSDGRESIFSYSGAPVLDENGRPTLSVVVSRDVTFEKAVQESLQRSEETARQRAEELEKLMNLVPAFIWVADDPECRTITGNRTANRFYESSGGENVSAGSAAIGKRDLIRRFFRDEREVPPEALPMQQAAATGKEIPDTEIALELPSGREVTMLGSATPLFHSDGTVRGAIGAFIDITERKKMERALRESEARFRTVVDNSRDGINMLDLRTGRYVFMSPAQIAMSDFTAEELNELSAEEFCARVHPDDRYLAVRQQRLAASGEDLPETVEYRWRVKSGEYRWFSDSRKLVRDQAGQPVALVGVSRDITERKLAEEALNRAVAELAETDRRKDEFLAILSHELRNPLAPIRFAVPLLERQQLDDAGARAVSVVQRQVEHLTRLVDDLLDVSRIANGKIVLRHEHVTLGSVVKSAAEAASPRIVAGRHTLSLIVPDDPIWLYGDPARLAQIVTNLLDNSAKYTPDGGDVTLEATADAGTATIRVRDNGIGIPSDSLPFLFEMFRQIERPGEVGSGLGIGLAVVKRLIEMHGGSVEAHSAGTGHGSEFVVRLPIAHDVGSVPAEESERVEAASKRIRVLIVDDNADLVEMLAMLVEAAGHAVRKALDGRSAISAALSFRPQVVLLDVGLPGMSGIDVAKELRSHPQMAGTRIVALTGRGQPEDRRQTREAGFDYHLVKPTDPEELERLLAAFAAEA